MLRKTSQSAFTIVELLIVIVVIAILAAISIVAFQGISGRAQTSVLKSDLANGARALGVAHSIDGKYPVSLGDISTEVALQPSKDNNFSYMPGANGASYCLQVSGGDQTYFITDTNSSPREGDCGGSGDGGGTVAVCSSFSVGDSGPGGGIIFYKVGNTCYEAAPAGWYAATAPNDPTAEFGCYSIDAPGAAGTAIGTGRQNTVDILAAGCTVAYGGSLLAADIATNNNGGGKSDWYLPSIDELSQIYAQKNSIGGLAEG